MKKKYNSSLKLVLITIILQTSLYSCSIQNNNVFKISRSTASNLEFSNQQIYSNALSIKKGTTHSKNENIFANLLVMSKKFKFIKLKLIEIENDLKDKAFKLNPKMNDGKFEIEIIYNKTSKYDENAIFELLDYLKNINPEDIEKQLSFYELIYNAKHGHIPSLKTLLSIKKNDNESHDMMRYLKSKTTQKHDKRKLIDELYTMNVRGIYKEGVERNNITVVVNMLNANLPWSQMTPFQTDFWKNYIKIIQNPLPIEKRILLYRGIAHKYDYDLEKLLNKDFKHHEIAKLIKSPFKRLSYHPTSKSFHTSDMTSLIKFHSLTSDESIFISTTTNLSQASFFAHDKIALYAIDPRLVIFNITNTLQHAQDKEIENEHLIPLHIMPKDVIGLVEVEDLKPNPVSRITNMSLLQERIDKVIRKHEIITNKAYKKELLKNTHIYNEKLKNGYDSTSLFYSTLENKVNKKIDSNAITKINTGFSNCIDLIKTFFK